MKLSTIAEKKLRQADRNSLSTGEFAVPSKRAYPIPDRSHAANALSRSSGKPVAARVKKKVCSKYPDMASCTEEFNRYVAMANLRENAGWTAKLNSEPMIVTQQQKDGTVKRLRVMRYWVEMSDGRHRLTFKVGKGKDGYPVFTDDRETRTGAAPVTHKGPLPGEEYAKAGSERKLTATGWANQVERLIGPAQVGQIFVQLIGKGFKAG